jgi:hypothetical protein
MKVDQNDATTNLQSRRAFLSAALLGFTAAITFSMAETEAAPIAGGANISKDVPDKITQGEKVQSADIVDQDKVQGAYGYYGHYRRVSRRVYRRSYRRTRRYVRRAYRRSYY